MPWLEKYRLAFVIAPVPMLLAAETGVIVLANDRLHDLFEYPSGELIGADVETLVPQDIRSHHPELRHAYQRVPTKRSMGAGRDLNGVTKSGNIIPLELGLEPISDDTERYALVTAIDIRQRKAHEKRMQQAMDAAASAMVMVNETGNIVFVNRAAAGLFGYSEEDLMGKPIETLVPGKFRRAHPVYTSSFMSDSVTRPMAKGRALFACHKDGSEIPVEISLTPVDSVGEKLVMSTIVDLSERIAASDAMARKNAELEQLNDELSRFAYSTSHDLKAPLSSIIGLMNFCIEDLDEGNTAEVRENLERTLEISQRAAEKVENFLRIARGEHGKVPAEDVDLLRCVQDIWQDQTAGRSQTKLTTDFAAGQTIRIAPVVLNSILENLISNALRYGDPNKEEHCISIGCKRHSDGVELLVTDNGTGIAKENIHKVFDIFQRLDARSQDGLGLSLVKKQVDWMGGSVTVESEEGEGTTFRLLLPQGDRI